MTEPKHWWQRRVTVNGATVTFCVLEGLSLAPFVALVNPLQLRDYSSVFAQTEKYMSFICFGAIMLLPIASLMPWHLQSDLRWVGGFTFLLLVAGILLPVTSR